MNTRILNGTKKTEIGFHGNLMVSWAVLSNKKGTAPKAEAIKVVGRWVWNQCKDFRKKIK